MKATVAYNLRFFLDGKGFNKSIQMYDTLDFAEVWVSCQLKLHTVLSQLSDFILFLSKSHKSSRNEGDSNTPLKYNSGYSS